MNLFSTKTSLHGLIGFSFYPPSSGNKLIDLYDIDNGVDTTDAQAWQDIAEKTENINILDS